MDNPLRQDLSQKQGTELYFLQSVNLLLKFSWVYNIKMTEFFTQRAWQRIPEDWLSALKQLTIEEMNAVPFGLIKDDYPASLAEFISTAATLSSVRHGKTSGLATPINISPLLTTGMSAKKLHEVSHLAAVIDKVCKRNNVSHVVDIGSGLGYLDVVLSSQLNYNILGLEHSVCMAHKAGKKSRLLLKRHNSNATASGEGVFKSIAFEVQDSADVYMRLQNLIDTTWPMDSTSGKHLGSHNVCVIGLHCCGDLTPSVLKAFVHCTSISCIVCIGCCYHKMSQELQPAVVSDFTQFPMSMALLRSIADLDKSAAQQLINIYGMRLAAQETKQRWRNQTSEDHSQHMKNVAYRGLLELACQQLGVDVVKTNRRLAKQDSYTSFDTFVDAVMAQQPCCKDLRSHFYCLHEEYKEYFVTIEPFTLLQVILQPVLEQLLLVDRVQFLHEQSNIAVADIELVFDDSISPRNCAIVADKFL